MSSPPLPPGSAALRASKAHKRRLTLVGKAISYLVLAVGGFTFMLPLAWMISTSLKPKGAVFTYPPEWVPRRQVMVWAPDIEHIFKDAWGPVYEGAIDGRRAVVAGGPWPGREAAQQEAVARILEPPDVARKYRLHGDPGMIELPMAWFKSARPRGAQRRVYWWTDSTGKRRRVVELRNWEYFKWVLALDASGGRPSIEGVQTRPIDFGPPEARRGVTDRLEPVRELDPHWDNYPRAWNALQSREPWLALNIPYAIRIPLGGRALQIGPVHFEGFHIRSAFTAFYLNSVLVAVCVTVGQVFTSSLAAYAFARLRFPGRDKLFLGYLGTLMVPYVVTMIPVFILLRLMHLIDTYAALILPAMFSAYGTFMLRQFFVTIPTELEDAARIDGCGKWGIYANVILPLSKPALATLTTFVFLTNWNSFMWPLIVISSPEKKTLPLGLYAFMGQYSTEWTLLMAASLMVLLPVLVVFVLGQRYFVRGIILSGLK